MSQVSKFGPRLSGWGCGTQGRRETQQNAQKLFMTAERTATPTSPHTSARLLSFQRFWCICGGLVRTFKTDAAILHPQSHPPAPMYRWISPGNCRASSCWCSSQRKVSARRWPARSGTAHGLCSRVTSGSELLKLLTFKHSTGSSAHWSAWTRYHENNVKSEEVKPVHWSCHNN